jgi:hypothetical protein
MHFSIGPWSRVLQRLDAVPTATIMASIPGSSRKRALEEAATPENTQPPTEEDGGRFSPPTKRARFHNRRTTETTAAASARLLQMTQPKPSTTADPFEFLPTHVVAEISQYLSPLEIVRNQRVSKAWRVVLASEYIYTLALRWHFPFSSEAANVWKLHHGGERYPAAAVDGYRAAAARYSRLPRGVRTFRIGAASDDQAREWDRQDRVWAMGEGWLVMCDGVVGGDKKIGVHRLSDRMEDVKWIDLGSVTVLDLAVGAGRLRVHYRWNEGRSPEVERDGAWVRMYDLSDLSLKWKREVDDNSVMVGNMTATCTSYLTKTEAGARNLHILSQSTGEQIKSASIPEMTSPKPPLTSFLTPDNKFLAALIDDYTRIFSTETGELVTFMPTRVWDRSQRIQIDFANPRHDSVLRDSNHQPIRYHFNEATNTLAVTDGVESKVWLVSFCGNKLKGRDFIDCPYSSKQSKTVLSPEGHKFSLYIDVDDAAKLWMVINSPLDSRVVGAANPMKMEEEIRKSWKGDYFVERDVKLMESKSPKCSETEWFSVRDFLCDEKLLVARCLDGEGTVWVVVDLGAHLDTEMEECMDYNFEAED